MKGKSLKVGTKLALVWNLPGKKPEEYYSKIVDEKENYIIIDYPVHKKTKKTKLLQVGMAFTASFVGDDEAVYQFPASIAARVKLNFPALAIPMPNPDDIQRIQRREFVRVNATVDAAVYRRAEREEAFTCVTSDISGGGLSLLLPKGKELELNEMLDMWLALSFQSGKYHYIHTSGQVVFTRLKNGLHTASIKFLSLKPKEQQVIMSYCFEKQREMRKKELS